MRLSSKYLFALAAVPLLAASMASATTITFANPNPPNPNQPPFSTGVLLGTYVSQTAPSFTVNGQGTSGTGGVNGGFIQQSGQGNLVPGVGGGKSACGLSPTPCATTATAAGTDTLTVTETGGGWFDFTGFDMNDQTNGSTAYTITGTLNGVTVFTAFGTDQGYHNLAGTQVGLWATVDPFAEPNNSGFNVLGQAGTNETLPTGNDMIHFASAGHTGTDGQINALTITFANSSTGSNFDIDNIVVTAVPEPSSLFLLGSGLLGLGTITRRKLFA
jgi:hypothetical protein